MVKKKEEKTKPPKSFFKRFWWIFLIILVIIIFIFIITKNEQNKNNLNQFQKDNNQTDNETMDKGEPPREFTKEELKLAETALNKGIKIEDPQNDWYRFPNNSIQPDGRPDNPNPYPFEYTDLKSVSLGADEKYLYIKYEFWGVFPNKMQFYNGDGITAVGGKIEEFAYLNNGTNDSAELGEGVGYAEPNGKEKTPECSAANKPSLGHLAMISVIGEDQFRELIFKKKEGKGMVFGGVGYNYLLEAYPLEEFGISYGQEVAFSSSTETSSCKYHHEVVDVLEGEGKTSARIKWKLGSDKYEINNNVSDNQNNPENNNTGQIIPNIPGLPSCPENLSNYFTIPFVPLEDLDHIIPLGAVGPDHIQPTDHIYLILKNNLKDVPVYAPTDVRITGIQEENFSKKVEVITDNHLMMYACEGLQLNYYHITNLSEKIRNTMKSVQKKCSNNTDSGGYYSEWCYYDVNISVSVGEQIGNSNSFDIGLYNYMKPQQFANPERYASDTNLYAMCPLDLYPDNLKNSFYSLLGDFGYNRTIEPRCGASMLDIVGTAQGSWYGSPVSDGDSQNKIAVLVPMSYNPEILGIDLGYAFPIQELLEFRPRSAGTINRVFSEIIPSDKIYCYYADGSSGTENVPGKILIQLINETFLRIEQQNGTCTGNENFVNPFIFQR